MNQYLLSASLIDARLSQWRLANVCERELLLGFKGDHTAGAITAAEAMADPFKAQDARAALLGNSLHAGIVAHLFWELLHQQGIMTNKLEFKVVATRMPIKQN